MTKAILVRDVDNISPPQPNKIQPVIPATRRHGPLNPSFCGDDVTRDIPTPPRWRCHHRTGGSDIEAWVAAKNGIETIAQTRAIDGVSARVNAELIVDAVNSHAQTWPLITELLQALELCLETGIVKWDAEQEADAVCRKVRRVMGI